MSPVLHIGIPLHDGRIHDECMRGVLETWGRWPCSISTVKGSFLPRNRDLIVDLFTHDESATHLLCVDSDMEWHASDVEKLLAMDAHFAFGQYVAKREPRTVQASRPIGPVHGVDGYELHEFDRCGAGFLLLSRECISSMLDAYGPSLSYVDAAGRPLVGLWQTEGRVELDGRMVAEGEDYAFCRRWRDIGGHILTRDDVRLGHVGERVWR